MKVKVKKVMKIKIKISSKMSKLSNAAVGCCLFLSEVSRQVNGNLKQVVARRRRL